MLVYSRISKRVGWAPRNVTYPTIKEVKELVNRALIGSEIAFERLFIFYRFLPSPINTTQIEVVNEIVDGFFKSSRQFK